MLLIYSISILYNYPICLSNFTIYFPTCQVRVVRFYVSCLLLLSSHLLSSSSSSSPPPPAQPRPSTTVVSVGPQPRPSFSVFPAGPQPRPSPPVFPAGPQPRPSPPVFPAGPQPRVSPPSVPCRTSTTTIHAQCSLPDLNREYPCQVFPAGPHVGRYGTKNVQKKVRKNVRQICYILFANSRVCGRVPGAMPLLTLQMAKFEAISLTPNGQVKQMIGIVSWAKVP